MIKRIFDIILSLLGLIILSPLFLIIALLIKVTSKGPVFFKQERVGKDEKVFKFYKFRTMIDGAWALGPPITTSEEDVRITKIGKILRKYKLDEFPQLINVLKGELSLVGPRPEIPKYVALYTPEQKMVLSVKPGIMDLASLKYIDENKLLSESKDWERTYIQKIMPDKIALNLKYIKERSLLLDLSIILKTLLKIFTR